MATGLILIDIQNDYFPGGAMELVEMESASAKSAQLLERFRQEGLPTFHIQHIAASREMPFFQPKTEGVLIHESIKALEGETVVTKHYPNSFRDSALAGELEKAGVDAVVICGAMSHMCVDATMRHASDAEIKCTLIHDACATRDLEFKGNTIDAKSVHDAYMSSLGWGYGEVLSAAEWLSK